MLSLTHLITMGRPVQFDLSAATAERWGVDESQWLLWTAYACNTASECFAFFTLGTLERSLAIAIENINRLRDGRDLLHRVA